MEQNTIALILVALLAVSELIAISPLKSNSIFQLVHGILKSIKAITNKELQSPEVKEEDEKK